MAERFEMEFPGGGRAAAVTLDAGDDVAAGIEALGLGRFRVSVAVVGGAAGMAAADLERAGPAVREVLAFVHARDGVLLDGGTDSGVFGIVGRTRASGSFDFPLVGVLPRRMAALDVRTAAEGAVRLEPNHTHFMLVPGSEWGDEVRWLAEAAGLLAAGSRAVTVLVNGGDLAWDEVEASVKAGRPVVVLAGSGRAADTLAAGLAGSAVAPRVQQLVSSGLLHRVELDAGDDLPPLLDRLLVGREGLAEARG